MQTIRYPKRKSWPELLVRPALQASDLQTLVREVFEQVQLRGDEAVAEYTARFDRVELPATQVSRQALRDAKNALPPALRKAMKMAKKHIETFHAAQAERVQVIETAPGVKCWRENRPIERVGMYIPGGTAPLFSTVLMLAVPARLAGCREMVLCSPPDAHGNIHPAIQYAAWLTGVRSVFKVGGIQAIAAMSQGTETIPRVDKIFGPGNQYVTAAKLLAQQQGVAIDMPAGPSEVLVIADRSARPEFVAADLLSQAEHGPDSQVILLTDSETLLEETLKELKKQRKKLPRKGIAKQALKQSRAILLKDLDTCLEFSNLYAPEHLILAVKNPRKWAQRVQSAGSVFLGHYSCESAGDYASGTNHTLPTNGYARSYSGVSLDSFVKKITFQQLSALGIQSIGPGVEIMAEAEQLQAHKNAVYVRLQSLQND